MSCRTIATFLTLATVPALTWAVGSSTGAADTGQAIEMIERLGGKYRLEADGSGRRLITINLEGTRVQDDDLRALREQDRLQELDLEETRITDKGLEHLADLKSLEVLDLEETRVTDAGLRHLEGLTNLRVLDLDDTRVSESAARALREKLKDLRIVGSIRRSGSPDRPSEADDHYDQEQAIEMIRRVGGRYRVDENRSDRPIISIDLEESQVQDDDLRYLGGLTHLRRLDLEETRITDEGLKHLRGLTSLEYLDLEETKITDEGLRHLEGLKNLRMLDLDDTQVSSAGIRTLQLALPDLRIER